MKSTLSPLVGIGYFVAAVLFFFPVIDMVANLWPLAPDRINWRYGAYLLASGFVLTMLLGVLLALLIGRAGGHLRTLRTIAVVSGVVGVFLMVAAVGFSLDALQLRGSVTGDARTQFEIGAMKAMVKNAAAGCGFLWMAWLGWRRDRGVAQRNRGGGTPVIAGQRDPS